jgi:hypothetical protein
MAVETKMFSGYWKHDHSKVGICAEVDGPFIERINWVCDVKESGELGGSIDKANGEDWTLDDFEEFWAVE